MGQHGRSGRAPAAAGSRAEQASGTWGALTVGRNPLLMTGLPLGTQLWASCVSLTLQTVFITGLHARRKDVRVGARNRRDAGP